VAALGEGTGLTPILVRMLEGRVGSTAMLQLLGTSSAVAFDRVYPFQNGYLTYFVRLTNQISRQNPTGQALVDFIYRSDVNIEPLPFQAGMIDPVDMARRALSAIWQEFSSSVIERSPGVRYYAEKYWGAIDPVIDAGIHPIIIDLVRDPRDIIASMRSFNERNSNLLFGRPLADDDWQHLQKTVLGMAQRFNEFALPVPFPRLRVRYEDFVTDMASQAAKIEALLDVDLNVGTVTADSPVLEGHMTAKSVDASIGRWRDDLAPSEVSFIERRLGASMRELGYV